MQQLRCMPAMCMASAYAAHSFVRYPYIKQRKRATKLPRRAGNYQQAVEITTYVLAAVTVIVLLLTLLMIRRIKIAVACLKVCAPR